MKLDLGHYKDILVPIIAKHFPHAKIFLYGSRARKDEGAGSDIDIALDNRIIINDAALRKLIEDIEESRLPILFDIVDFNKVSERLKTEILKDGVIWKNY